MKRSYNRYNELEGIGKEREKILSYLKPILDIVEARDDKITIYEDPIFYGFHFISEFFNIQWIFCRNYWLTDGKSGVVFGVGSNFHDKDGHFLSLGSFTEIGEEDAKKEFFNLLKDAVDMCIENHTEEIKRYLNIKNIHILTKKET